MDAVIMGQTAQRREKMFNSTKAKIAASKRLTKHDMGYEVGHQSACHPASIYWNQYSRAEMVEMFNAFFGTSIQ